MRVLSLRRLREFWMRSGRGRAEIPLRGWYRHVGHRRVDWRSWGDVKADYPSASTVGNCVVFNIGGNKYRLVTRILYSSHIVLVLAVLTHAEYDEGKWQADCGCYDRSSKGDDA